MTAEFGSYKIEDAAGVGAHLAVVRGAGEGGVKKPTGENEGKFVGITSAAQANQNKAVSVQRSGSAWAKAAGAIAYGDAVNIAGATGKLQSCQADYAAAAGVAKNLYVVGFAETAAGADNDLFTVHVRPHLVKTAAS